MATGRMRGNKINFLIVGDSRMEDRERITSHIIDYFQNIYSNNRRVKPSVDNLQFSTISREAAIWLEEEFQEEEVRTAVFNLASDKALGPDGFPISFFQKHWDLLKAEIMAFMIEFYMRGRLSRSIGASFIALIPKRAGADCIKDFRPISLLVSIYKILAKVLASRLQKILPSIISHSQGAFVHGR